MKIRWNNILGKSPMAATGQVLEALAIAGSEAVIIDKKQPGTEKNIFGRTVNTLTSGDIPILSGFCSTGLRGTAFVSSRELIKNFLSVAEAVRKHIPLTFFTYYDNQEELHQLGPTGAFQLWAGNPQEAADFLLIAQRISEKSLIPGIVGLKVSRAFEEEEISVPSAEQLMRFLGKPEARIPSPTPSQQMLFGKFRRRIPSWHNPDVPVLSGAKKDPRGMAFEGAANNQYFSGHLEDIITRVFEEFETVTGRKYHTLEKGDSHKHKYALIFAGEDTSSLSDLTIHLPAKLKNVIQFIKINMVYPFPENPIIDATKKIKAIASLEEYSRGAGTPSLYKELKALSEKREIDVFSNIYYQIPSSGELQEVIENILPSGKNQPVTWIGIPFTFSGSSYPKHEVLLQEINREYPGIKDHSIIDSRMADRPRKSGMPEIPWVLNTYSDKGPSYSRISNFYDHTALVYDPSDLELAADPFQAIPVIPPSTASLGDFRNTREKTPVFMASNCTGCGDCFIHCPHSAIPPLSIKPEQLINSGIKMASSNNTPVVSLMPLVKNWAKEAGKFLRSNDNINAVKDFLMPAFEEAAGKMKLPEEKIKQAREDAEKIISLIGNFPAAKTETFFTKPEEINPGTGEIFNLTIDPFACTGCGLCADVCPDNALEMQATNPTLNDNHLENLHLWEKFPDTSGDTITRILDAGEYDPFAAVLLSRNFYMSVTGGEITGSSNAGEKAMIHILTAAAEASLQPKVQKLATLLRDFHSRLSDNIRKQIFSSMPDEDFGNLEEILKESKPDTVSFEEIIEKWSSREDFKLLEKSSLERKINLARLLKEFLHSVEEGSTGQGRSRFSLIFDQATSAGGQYPLNNYNFPVVINWDHHTPAMAYGIVLGHIRNLVENIKLIRRASLEVENKYDARFHDNEVAGLSWENLTDEERSFIPPVFVLLRKQTFNSSSFREISRLTGSGFPVKIVILDNGLPAGEINESIFKEETAGLLSILMSSDIPLVKGSLADPNHLFYGFQRGINNASPSVTWVFCPDYTFVDDSPGKKASLTLLANETRAFTHLETVKTENKKTIASRMNISNNPSNEEDWKKDRLVYSSGEEENSLEYEISWADWAFSLKEFRDQFTPIGEGGNEKEIPVTEYIRLTEQEQKGKTPYICRVSPEGNLLKFAVPEYIVNATKGCLDAWDILRDISGTSTDFPEKMREKAEQELTRKFEDERETLKREYEEKINNLESAHLEKIRLKLKEKLVSLSHHAKNGE